MSVSKLLKERNVEWLFHFTRAENLPNIVKYGIMPRNYLELKDIEMIINDPYRYDGCENAICLTVEFPNYKMFYKLRMQNEEVKWAVVKLDAKLICDLECAFCNDNAGSAKVYNIPINERKGEKAFERMFDELPNGYTREELNIDSWFPTSPQAEILVFDIVPITYFNSIFFDNNRTYNKYKELIPPEIEIKIDNKVFYPRKDWELWR